MALLGEVYVEARIGSGLHELAHWATFKQIDNLRCIHEAECNETPERVEIRLQLVEDGLRWLRAVGKSNWAHALLFNKGIALTALGRHEEALDTQETAYRLRKTSGGPGYQDATHAWRTARCAAALGLYERGLEVLKAEEHDGVEPITHAQMLLERVRIYQALETPLLLEALQEGRRMCELANSGQHERIILFAHSEMSRIAIAVESFSEALAALERVHEILTTHDSYYHRFYLQEAKRAFTHAQKIPADHPNPAAQAIRRRVTEWSAEPYQASA